MAKANKNTIRQNLESILYNTSQQARVNTNNANVSLRGESPTKQPIEEAQTTPATFADAKNVIEQDQEKLFCSITDRPYYEGNPEIPTAKPQEDEKLTDYNSVKGIERDVGDLTGLASVVSANSKDKRVIKNNTQSIKETVDKDYENKKADPIFGSNLMSTDNFLNNVKNHWGFEVATVNYREKLKGHPVQEPHVLIIEDRVGTASYKEIGTKGTYSSKDVVELRILRNVENYSFGTTQQFDDIEPRGSQTPLRFYNKNTGRTLSFSADFHQQEYPLEPLMSIAEKAQYFCRPYRHGDYALIPKLVRVEIPGRVFRGYMQQANISYKGDDYRSWSLLGLNEQNIGRLGYTIENNGTISNVYGVTPRIEKKSNTVRNDNSVEAINYGLGELNIQFTLLITEEIILTSYETDTEKEIRHKQEEKDVNAIEIQEALAKAKYYMSLSNKSWNFTPEDLVLVDANGKYVGLLITPDGTVVTDENGQPVRSDTVSYLTVKEWNESVEERRLNKESKAKGLTTELPVEATMVTDQTTMMAYLIGKEKKENPNKTEAQIKQELEEKYGGDYSKLYDDYKRAINKTDANGNSLSEDQSVFLSSSYNLNITSSNLKKDNGKVLGVTSSLSINKDLNELLKNELKNVDDLRKFIYDFHGEGSTRTEWNVEVHYSYYTFKPSGEPYIWPSPTYYKKELWEVVYDYNKSEFNNYGLYGDVNDFENMYWKIEEMNLTDNQKNYLIKIIGKDKFEMQYLYKETRTFILVDGDKNAVINYILMVLGKFRDAFYGAFSDWLNRIRISSNNSASAYIQVPTIKKMIEDRDILFFPDEPSFRNKTALDNKTVLGKLEDINNNKYDDIELYHHVYGYYLIKDSI